MTYSVAKYHTYKYYHYIYNRINAYECISDNNNIDPPVLLEQNVTDSRQISLQQNVCYGTTSEANYSERDE